MSEKMSKIITFLLACCYFPPLRKFLSKINTGIFFTKTSSYSKKLPLELVNESIAFLPYGKAAKLLHSSKSHALAHLAAKWTSKLEAISPQLKTSGNLTSRFLAWACSIHERITAFLAAVIVIFLEEDEPITQEELRQQLRAQDREINVLRQQFRLQQEISRVQQEISQVQQQQIQYLLNQFGIEQQRIHRQLCKSQWANQITNLQFQIDQLKNQIANFAPQVDQLSQQIDQASCSRQSQEFPQPQAADDDISALHAEIGYRSPMIFPIHHHDGYGSFATAQASSSSQLQSQGSQGRELQLISPSPPTTQSLLSAPLRIPSTSHRTRIPAPTTAAQPELRRRRSLFE